MCTYHEYPIYNNKDINSVLLYFLENPSNRTANVEDIYEKKSPSDAASTSNAANTGGDTMSSVEAESVVCATVDESANASTSGNILKLDMPTAQDDHTKDAQVIEEKREKENSELIEEDEKPKTFRHTRNSIRLNHIHMERYHEFHIANTQSSPDMSSSKSNSASTGIYETRSEANAGSSLSMREQFERRNGTGNTGKTAKMPPTVGGSPAHTNDNANANANRMLVLRHPTDVRFSTDSSSSTSASEASDDLYGDVTKNPIRINTTSSSDYTGNTGDKSASCNSLHGRGADGAVPHPKSALRKESAYGKKSANFSIFRGSDSSKVGNSPYLDGTLRGGRRDKGRNMDCMQSVETAPTIPCTGNGNRMPSTPIARKSVSSSNDGIEDAEGTPNENMLMRRSVTFTMNEVREYEPQSPPSLTGTCGVLVNFRKLYLLSIAILRNTGWCI